MGFMYLVIGITKNIVDITLTNVISPAGAGDFAAFYCCSNVPRLGAVRAGKLTSPSAAR